MPVHLIDTAGLRDTGDAVERIGVERARAEMAKADRVLWVYDGHADPEHAGFHPTELPEGVPVTFVRNKADLSGETIGERETAEGMEIAVSAKVGEGIEQLREHLKGVMGYAGSAEGAFIARRRHLDAIERAQAHLDQGQAALLGGAAGELLAEDLRQAQHALSEITGEFTADDLLGEIFSSFCIGK
jgi:tRNA modification GTPase